MQSLEAVKQTDARIDFDDAIAQLSAMWQKGELSACLAFARNLSEWYPSSGLVWKILGSMYQQTGDLALAQQAFSQAALLAPEDAEIFFNLANVCAQQQATPQAIRHYQAAIERNPSFTAAIANLAVLHKAQAHTKEAEGLLREALTRYPQDGRLLFEMAALLHETGKTFEAMPFYRQAVAVEADNAVLMYNFAQALTQLENHAEAQHFYELAIALSPTYLDAYWHLGDVRRFQHAFQAAEEAYLLALSMDDAHWGVYNSLAQLYKQMQLPEAYQACIARLMQLNAPDPDQLNQFAAQLIQQNLIVDAERFCQQAIDMADNNPYVFCNMAVIMHHRQAYAEAVNFYEKALAIQPEIAAIWSNYSVSLKMLGQISQAHKALAHALHLNPEYVDAHINLGTLYLDEGKIAEAVLTFQHVLTLDPSNDKGYRNLLFADSYANVLGATAHVEVARALSKLWMSKATPFESWFCHPQDQRLRIGLVSADLHSHPVAYFLLNWLSQVDAGQTEIYAYSTNGKEDSFTAQLKPYCVQWRSLASMPDAQAAARIREDGIHILLDLSGFTSDSRVSLFAWKPAPIQASWLGYWDTTGLTSMDALITDAVSAPPELQTQFTETLAYLPDTRLCFSPPQFEIDVHPLPALTRGHITFGCFQNYSKVSDAVLALWAQVFSAMPDAHLYWQCKAFSDQAMQAQALQRLQLAGIDASRCQLVGKMPRAEYLAAYHKIDLLLDTSPFTGGTTTCEALWMGVPTVTLAGDTMIARQGAALMSAAGLADWVATDAQEYVRLALNKASHLETLAALRAGLRPQVMQSALMDGPLFAKHMQALLWQLWQAYLPRFADQLLQTDPIQHAYCSDDPLWLVSATRMDETQFWAESALGRSLKRQQKQDSRLHPVITFNNRRGLSEIFNAAIAQAPDNAILVFVHDDVWLDENPFAASVYAGLEAFDVIGLAGNKRSLPAQPAWLFADLSFTWEKASYLLGAVAHGASPFGYAQPYGERAGECLLMDGVFLAAKKHTLINAQVQFDPRFDFHFYDLDFCQTASQQGLRLGVWPIAITHQSDGAFGSAGWRERYQVYLKKWFPNDATAQVAHALALENAVAEVLQLAQVAISAGDVEQASTLLKEILQIAPTHIEANALLTQLNTSGTASHVKETLRADKPALIDAPESQLETVLALFEAQRYPEMEALLTALLAAHPTWYTGWRMLSDVFLIQKKDARQPAAQVLSLNKQDPQAHIYYGVVLKAAGDSQHAAEAFRQAIALNPQDANAHNNLATVLKDIGELSAAIAHFKQALSLQPNDATCFSNLLFCLAHAPDTDVHDLQAAHDAFADLYEAPLKAHWPAHPLGNPTKRPLNIGWVSADFRAHSVANFLLPLLPMLATRDDINMFAYANQPLVDALTLQIQPYFTQWLEVSSMPDDALAERIRQDGIDILIDLSGHTAGNRLLTFARKPAPIQVSWLGYLNSTGLTAMDYYLCDSFVLPPDIYDAQFSEQLVQLPVYACFSPEPLAPAVNPLPALKNGYVTFACFNRPNKINACTVALWAQLMQAVPESRMVLGGLPAETDPSYLYAWFTDAGIAPERVQCLPQGAMEAYLQYYHQVDVCLDTFPANGVTTTAHALWMGVPTLTIAGDRHASRGAMALLQHVGLDDWVAQDHADFVTRGRALCASLTQLQTLRQQLRAQMQASPLMQAEPLAHALCTVFDQMWSSWCQKSASATPVTDTQAMSPLAEVSPPLLQAPAINETEYWLQAAQSAHDANDPTRAAACYQSLLALEPHHGFAHHALGLLQAHEDGVAAALTHFEAAVIASPNEEQYWVTYIDALFLLGDTASAAQAIEQGQSFGLSEAMAVMLSQEYVEKLEATWTEKQTSPAHTVPTSALHPSASEVIAQAQQSLDKGQILVASTLYQEVLQLFPTHAQANHEYGRLLAETDSLEVAMPYLEVAIANAPSAEQYWVTYIDALMQLGALKTVFESIQAGSKYALSADMQATLYQDAVNHAIAQLGQAGGDDTQTLSILIQDTGLFDQIVQDNIRAVQQAQQSGAVVTGNMDMTACQQFLTQFPALLAPVRLVPFIRLMVAKLMWVPALIGHKIYAPYFDHLLSEIQLNTARPHPRASKHANVVIATEIYDFGGHTKEIISILNTVENPMLVITDLYGRFASQPFYQKIASALPAHCPVVVLPQEEYLEKSTRLAGLINQHARNVFLLTHHDDVVAAVACQPQLDAHYYFIHHADHNLAIGNAIAQFQHVDLFGGRVQHCQEDLQRETRFLPTTATDMGCKDFTTASREIGTVTAGSFGKFNTEGAIALAQMIGECLQLTEGKHYHFGEIPAPVLAQLGAHLQQQGVDAERFVYAGNVPSLWQALLDIDAHVFVGSAPIAGAKSDIEAQGAGYPLLAYKALDCPRHLNVGSHAPSTVYWHDMASLRSGLQKIKAQHTQYSALSRQYYESACSVQAYQTTLLHMSK